MRRTGKEKEKIMLFLVATNVDASQLPKRRPTGTPHARANFNINATKIILMGFDTIEINLV